VNVTARCPSRWSALGNTYLVVERGENELTPDAVRGLCADADGVVEVASVQGATADVVIWNRDGTTAELSGNGTRIAARWLAGRTGAERVLIRVGPRAVDARMLDGADVETDMGPVGVAEPERVDGIELVRVDVGNPHAVIRADPAEVQRLGPLLVGHAAFPGGANIEVARVDAPGQVTARVWERGVGETTASGTGAVAVAAATHGDGDVLVRFPGGDLRVLLAGGRAILRGPAERDRREARGSAGAGDPPP
jgi:diaminopimelate epimerase